ncbi:NmrA/HSCARG family protein [Streptomyces solicathayae]|uniref:NmrA family NAD(P)-binding protein n=1 Tax=Streptomyces solicathayae TaxID=3081768 RepID=A0ABZ0LNJ4_9ACTN|nr:NmrA family NAD(P)-binding protein [Streptomyces sp. HUAS YS2]WOX20796.1 NmrA family NAD(P)-binding protein [Streptomyces sp. HUAS YS2]
MTERKIITVIGATGRQGGGLVRAVLADRDGEFTVRAVTRHPDGEPAAELKRLGVEVVRADMDDPPSLAPAFEHAYGAFVVTNFWEHMSAEREKTQAHAVARAAAHAGVQHAIWSTLEDTRECIPLDDERMPTLQERYKVPHFDGKAEADHHFPDEGVPTTFLRTTFYWENLLGAYAPQRGADGALQLTFPMGGSRLSGVAVADIGRTALAVLRRGTDLIAATISSAANTSRSPTWPPPSRRRGANRCATGPSPPTSGARRDSPARTSRGTCSSTTRTASTASPRPGTSSPSANSTRNYRTSPPGWPPTATHGATPDPDGAPHPRSSSARRRASSWRRPSVCGSAPVSS